MNKFTTSILQMQKQLIASSLKIQLTDGMDNKSGNMRLQMFVAWVHQVSQRMSLYSVICDFYPYIQIYYGFL